MAYKIRFEPICSFLGTSRDRSVAAEGTDPPRLWRHPRFAVLWVDATAPWTRLSPHVQNGERAERRFQR